jgi:site-specific DNA recombinase
MRAVIYARYSSDLQSASSIDDQVRLCRERIQRDGHQLVRVYTDRAVSGSTLRRPGIQALMQDICEFDLAYAEALDRVSRDQEDVAGVFKRLRYADVSITTLAEGEISELHVGLKGTMNALFLKDLAAKTRRGLRGRVEAGRSGGGNSYGYNVVRAPREDGTVDAGRRQINLAEAEVVRRIFRGYSDGSSPRKIAGPKPRRYSWSLWRGVGSVNNQWQCGQRHGRSQQ